MTTPLVRRTRRRVPRWLGWTLSIVVVLFAAWIAVGYAVFVSPHVNKLEHADAVVVLGGPFVDGRLDYAKRLVDEQYADTLVISNGAERDDPTHWPCTGFESAAAAVRCFIPEPDTTQGEAREIRGYAEQYGWTKIIVVTSSYHVSRARMIIERCFDGQVMMTSPAAPHSFARIASEYLYQTAGYAKAWTVTTGC